MSSGVRSELRVPDVEDRSDLGAFVGRVVRLDQTATVRLRAVDGVVTAWATTPFEVLATRSTPGTMEPDDLTVPAASLLAALSVDRAAVVDPGFGGVWTAELPPATGWKRVEDVPAAEIDQLTERGLRLARENAGPLGPPASLLDQTVLTVSPPDGPSVKVPMRALFALSGMGFVGPPEGIVRVSEAAGWMRVDARYGAVVRRRTTALPLLF